MIRITTAAAFVGLFAWVGCHHEPASAPASVGGGPIDRGQAVEQLAQARCNREQRCANIGQGKDWSDMNACMTAMRAKENGDFTQDQCPNGINGREVSDCISAIQQEGCLDVVQWFDRLKECRTGEMCI